MTIRGLLWAIPLLFAGWLTVLAVVMVASDAAPGAVVILPDPAFLARLPEGVAIISATALTVTVKSDMPDFGRTLYKAGARLVLPAGLTGCLPLPGQVPLQNAS